MPNAADTHWLTERAKALGFDLCGVVRAEKFTEHAQFTEWLARGYAGEMHYLEDPKRRDPWLVLEGIRSVIVCALNYNAHHPHSVDAAAAAADAEEPRGWISRYAWGRDYHEVLWEKLNALSVALGERFGDSFAARAYADTGPIAERLFAKHAGLGWIGKNTLLLNENLGSWFFLGVIVTSLELEPSMGAAEAPPPDLCGQCRQCLDACPTAALVEPYVLDARRCISYLTIELRGSIPEEFREPMGWQVYGCDICQDVCPFNRDAPVTALEDFKPRHWAGPEAQRIPQGLPPESGGRKNRESPVVEEEVTPGLKPRPPKEESHPSADAGESLLMPRLEWLAGMAEEEFRERFRGSAVKRTKWAGLVRNACIALGNSRLRRVGEQQEHIVALLQRLAQSEISTVAESAQWALSRIQ